MSKDNVKKISLSEIANKAYADNITPMQRFEEFEAVMDAATAEINKAMTPAGAEPFMTVGCGVDSLDLSMGRPNVTGGCYVVFMGASRKKTFFDMRFDMAAGEINIANALAASADMKSDFDRFLGGAENFSQKLEKLTEFLATTAGKAKAIDERAKKFPPASGPTPR